MTSRAKVKSKEELADVIKKLKESGKTVVQCHGCFDIIHPGHVRYLEQSKKFGDVLVVSLTPDKYILKGDDRPYMPQELRVNSMAALEIVDYVCLDSDSWAGPLLDMVQPNIYVKGKEYENTHDGVFGQERKIVEAYGGQVYFTSGDVVFSSSRLIEDFKKKFALDYEVFNVYCKRNNITLNNLLSRLDSFNDKKVVVIGEVILDEYVHTEVLDLAAEAPILTLRPVETKTYVGAAGIVSKHLKNLGANSSLVSIVNNTSPDTLYIEKDLTDTGVSYDFIRREKTPTIKKTRFIADVQKLLKIDYSEPITMTGEEETQVVELIKKKHADADAIIFSDFAYGFVSDRIREEVTAWANDNEIKVIADVSSTLGGNISKYKNTFLITPTEKEARMVFDDKKSGLSNIAHRLISLTKSKNIIITLGANGVLAFKNQPFKVYGKDENYLENEFIPALEKNAIDPMGAGDAMLSMSTLVTVSGGSIAEAVYLGNIASYIEVNKIGNIPIKLSEVKDFLMQRSELTDQLND
ncbi:PfkB family carbohydrate kinase [Vicingaceae bacterium]|nr:PfkB family carbohydrate kinase [Vicingaceae bacterium]